jgi:hypothetical protein
MGFNSALKGLNKFRKSQHVSHEDSLLVRFGFDKERHIVIAVN